MGDFGWYTPNSVDVEEIVPEWRRPGGGVSKDDIGSYNKALDKAVEYTLQRLAVTERHLMWLRSDAQVRGTWGK